MTNSRLKIWDFLISSWELKFYILLMVLYLLKGNMQHIYLMNFNVIENLFVRFLHIQVIDQ